MIPILFETTETAFTSNGIGRLTEAISCEVEEERNGVYELTLEYPMTGRLYGEISEGRFIYSRHSDALDAQPFRIYKITKPMDGIVTVHAHHRSYDLNHVIVQPFTAGSAAETMQRISLNTLNACPFTFWTDKSVTADFNLKVPASIRSILGGAEGSILDVYGKGEYEWDNATVKLHLNRGTDTGVTIMYGKNLTDINEESTAENLVSAVAPFWKDAEGENVVVLPEGILTLAGASSENALPLDLSDKFDEAPTVEDLRSKANTWLTNNGKLEPESNIRLSFAQLWQTEEYKSYALLQRVNLCDTVTVIYPALGVKAKTKVIRVVYDALLERYTKMELGEPKSTLSGTLARQEETVRQIVRSFQYPTISQVNAAVNTATKLITGGMGGHVVIGTNANGQPNEILIMDTDDIDTAVNVIRMNANGIGFSTTGYNGPFNTAWTIDGAFVADFITSGTLDANLIRAGIIMDKAGKNYWNLETGEISIDASAIGEDYVTSSQLEVTKNGIMASVSQTYVTKGNAVSSVATQYYSSTSPDSPQGGSWQDTVPDWQDGRYIFEKTVTMTADGQSEEKIVCISGATGATGERGPGIYKVTTEPSSFKTETGGFTPTYRIALATAKIQSGVSDVFVGDVIEYDVYHYPVGYVDASYVYLGARTSIKGADGLPATAYTLIVSHAAIAKSASGTFAPASITLTAKSQTGTNAYANYSGRFKIEVHNGSSWSTKYTSSSNENTKSYTIPSGTTQVRCSLYLADGTSTLLDQQTIPVVSDGAAGGDAYTIILDNESHTFAGGTSAAIAGTATVNVYAYKGATAIAPTVTKANISGLPTGMTAQSVTNDSSNNKTTIVFAVTTSMVTRSGLVTIPVVADGKTFNKEFSYSLALQGTKGDKGDTGKSLTGITEYYARNNSTTAPADSAFNTSVLTPTASEKYVWNYEQLSWNDNGTTSTTKTTKRIIAVYGDKGETGDKGNTGKSLTNVTEYYAVNNSTTAPADSSFSTTVAAPTSSNKYLWNYELLTWDDNGTTSTTKTDKHIAAAYGDKGDKGDTGKALTGITEYYALNNSTTAPADSSFSTTVKTPTASNKYVWNYEQLSWNDNGTTSTTKTTKHIVAVYGDKGDQGDKGNTGKALTGITEYYAINNSTTAPADSAFGTSVKAPTSSNKYLWNYELLAWNDNGTTSTTKTDKHIAAIYGDKGDKGDTGVSISSVTNYYLATSASSGVTTSTSGWTTTVQTMDATKQYLWNYEVVTGSNNSTLNTTTPVIIGRYGQNGGKGDTGRGITSITEHYQVSSSNSTAPTTWSDTMVNTTATNKYLWNYETITYTDGTTEDSTKRVIGTHGEKGDTGASIASVTNYYLASASSSGVTTSTSGWTTNPTASAATMTSTKQYLWNYEVIKDSNNTTITTTSPVIIGRYGQNGGTGSAGKGITGITEYYLATSASSGVTTSTSGWTTAVQSTTATNKYLWNYEVISYTSGNPYTSDPRIIGTYGDKGDKGNKGDKGDKGDRGATWYAGTGITGTSTTATIFSGSGVASAIVGDHYLNTSTQNVYRCTVAGAASTAKWVYEQNIKGARGTQGVKGDTGDTCYFHIKYSNDGGATFTGNSGEDAGSYIGTYSDNTEADSTSVSSYKWVKIEGDDGTSVTVSSIKYAVSSTESQPADSAFTYTSVPTVAEGSWLWTLTTYSNGSKAYTKAKQGRKGDPGSSVTVSSIKYAVSTTETQPADSSFTHTSVPTVAEGSWLWTLTTFSNGSKVYSKAKQGKGGTNGTTFTPSVDANGNISWTNDGGKTNPTAVNIKGPQGNKGDKGDKGVGVTSITKTGTSGTVDTYTIKYTDNTSTTFTVTNGTNGTNGTSAEWFYGTALTHTSGTATATISGAKVGDMYLNTATSNVYKCTAANTWTYAGNIADGVIDNISIGGRNLLKGTGNYSEWNALPSSESRLIRTTEYIRFNPYEEREWWWIEPHDAYIPIDEWDTTAKYTASIDIKFEGLKTRPSYPVISIMTAQNNTTQGYSNRVYETSLRCIPSIQGDWVHYTYTFYGDYTKWRHAGSGESLYVKGLIWLYINSSEVDAVYIRNFKLEKGNCATDWTPAPEDVQADIATAQATADRKKQTFISAPTTPYYVGDTYFVNGKLLVCHTERLTGSYTADDWSEDLGYASSDTVATLEASTKTELDTIRSEASANYTSLSDSLDKIQASFNTQVEQTSEDFSIRINGLLESLTSLANDTSTKFAEYSKYFRFTADGLEIGEESNALTLVLDNDKISFRRNGVEFSYWDGSDNSFHVGDIIVDVNQVARFGSFGLVPLEGGDLAWKWLGGST